VSVAVALFPTFSRDAALGRIADIRRQLSTSLRILIFLAAPLTATMIVLARPIAAVFFQYGLFSGAATERTAGALVFFSIGLSGHIVVHVLTRAFYAMQDTRIPVLWAIIGSPSNPSATILSGPMGLRPGAGLDQRHAEGRAGASLRRRIESITSRRPPSACSGPAPSAGVAFAGLQPRRDGLPICSPTAPWCRPGDPGRAGPRPTSVAIALRPMSRQVRRYCSAGHGTHDDFRAATAGDEVPGRRWATALPATSARLAGPPSPFDASRSDGCPEEDGEIVVLVAAQERDAPRSRLLVRPARAGVDYADARAADLLCAVTIGLREVAAARRAKPEPRIEPIRPRWPLLANGLTHDRSRSARRAWLSCR
jgi:hypothetical protein